MECRTLIQTFLFYYKPNLWTLRCSPKAKSFLQLPLLHGPFAERSTPPGPWCLINANLNRNPRRVTVHYFFLRMKFVAAACNRHVQSASWHPSEQGFVAFGTHHLVALWRPLLETYPGVICTLRGHSAPVTCVKWFPDVNEFVSASIDATLRIWKTVKDVSLEITSIFSY